MKRFSKAEVESWPEGHKGCTRCLRVLPLLSFHKHGGPDSPGRRGGLYGLSQQCKDCRRVRSRDQYQALSPERLILQRARFRARKRGLEFDLTVEDIEIPELCPALGVPLQRGSLTDSEYSPSIDRLDPTRGYVKGNVRIISNRANRIKNNATAEELEAVLRYVRSGVE